MASSTTRAGELALVTAMPAPLPGSPAPIAKATVKVSTVDSFLVGALAACTAVTVTNPFEVVKTRMQLHGELGGKGTYQSPLKVFRITLQHEGIRGVQRGLGPAYIYQILLNGSRLGFYEPFRTSFNRLSGRERRETWTLGSLAAGASSGVVGGKLHRWQKLRPSKPQSPPTGPLISRIFARLVFPALLGNPSFLIKARLQAYFPQLDPAQARHRYTSTFNGLSTILQAEGFRGLTRGWDAAVLRTAMGSTVQLPAYNLAKSYLSNLTASDTFAHNPLLLFAGKPNSFSTYLASSVFSGLCVCAVMQPADTALTRMYNQPVKVMPNGKTVGVLYRGPLHCLYLTAKAEGPLAWYKVSAVRRLPQWSYCER